jgi:polar amino acid transport system substrate-binding protein
MPKTPLAFYLHVIAIVVVIVAGNNFLSTKPGSAVSQPTSAAAPGESVFDRVLRTKTIRCGYGVWPPIIAKDPNTGQMSGIYYDVMNEVGKKLGFKVDWVEEVPWGDFSTAIDAGRIDMFCAPMAPVPARIAQAYFTSGIAYIEMAPFVRADDTRFDNNFERINSPDVTLSVIDGELSSIIARESFPKAKLLEIAPLVGNSQAIINVAERKADVVFIEPFSVEEYMKNNPGKIKKLPSAEPWGIMSGSMPTKLGDDKFLWLMNASLQHLQNIGFVERTLQHYNASPSMYLRSSKPYQLPAKN